jgi:VWFA-related protein
MQRAVIKRCVSVAVALIGAATALEFSAAVSGAQQAPTFRAGIDLVSVDVTVIGNDGKPVSGLTAADFSLAVDGRPRRIASAEYVSRRHEAGTPSAPAAATYSTNAAGAGRLIMFVVDRSSIGPGRGRPALDSANRFISQLSPADRIGLIAIGGGGQIEFTKNHSLIQAALPGLTGQAETFTSARRIGVSEAIAIQRGDLNVLTGLIARECGTLRTPEEQEACKAQIGFEANGLASLVRQRTQNSLGVLRTLTDRLAGVPGPKTIVYLSEGLVVESISDLSWLGAAATRAQMTIHTMHLETPAADASLAREPSTPGQDRALAKEGLEIVADASRGGFFPIASSADNAFARLALELSGYYVLGFEPDPTDKDGQLHKIKVTVPGRSGIAVRARAEFRTEVTRVKTDEALLADALQAPIPATDIGLKLAAFTFKEVSSEKMRILMVAEIDRGANPEGHLALAYVLLAEKGQVIASQLDRDVKVPVHPDSKIQTYTGFVTSDSNGPHTLKIAVLDDKGKRGSVEHTFQPALTPIGELKAADLLLAGERGGEKTATPLIGSDVTSGVVSPYIELYSSSGDQLKSASVIFEIAPTEDGRAIDGAVGKVQPSSADSPDRRAIEGSIPTRLLPPGDYVMRAVISQDGRRLGQIAKPFKVGRMAPSTSKPEPGIALMGSSIKSATVPFVSRIDRFDRASVLTPEVVGVFMQRVNFSGGGEANAAPVIDHAKAGRFDEAVGALASRSGTVPAAFLSGLALYAKGQLEPAAAKFRDALRLDSEFFPAAFYLGSCYAAGGRDQEAVGAWQLTLVTHSDAPFIFTLLADALLRLRDAAQALEVLNEAAAGWPEDNEVQVRMGLAYAMSGKRADALQKLEPYLAAHPDDHERHFVALRTLYDARAAGTPVRTLEEDRALFTKWAAAYAAAKGPQQAMVDQWQRAMNR